VTSAVEERPAGHGVARAKQAAADAAVAMIESGMVVGLGSGTTAAFFINALGIRIQSGLRITGVPTSNQTSSLAAAQGIPLTDLEKHPQIDIDVDGADEIDPELNVLKGGGGALLHEKIVALASQRLVVIADQTKLVEKIGIRRPIPVEVVAFGWVATRAHILALGGEATIRGGANSPFVTDSGNVILDATLPIEADLFSFADQLKGLTGVVDHGLFRHAAGLALIGSPDGSVETRRPETTLPS
jgi:ribose 5-phosphate isomerase A